MASGQRYKMRTLARLTGLSPLLLRAWERRHGLLEPERTAGGHRLYTDDDVRVLRRVQTLLQEGRSIGEVAALGRAALLAAPVLPVPLRANGITNGNGDGVPALPGAAEGGGASLDPGGAGAPSPAAGSGGRFGPAPGSTGSALRWRDELVQAGLTLDGPRGERALDEAFAALSADRAIADVVEPALAAIGDLWAQGRCTVAGEHLVSGLVVARLHPLLDAAGARSPDRRLVICACFPEEQHALGALVVAHALARRGFGIAWLGPALPLDDLDQACATLRPEAVFLSVTRRPLFELHAGRLAEVARRHAALRFHVGGSGVIDHRGLVEAGVVLDASTSIADLLRGDDGRAADGRAADVRRPADGGAATEAGARPRRSRRAR